MALDHYVSQVHLKRFYSPKLGELMYAIRKSNLEYFTPDARSVCRIKQGNTNRYLRDDQSIETFLKGIEPKYNAAVNNLTRNQIRREDIFAIAGFVAYILTCTPGAMRIHAGFLRNLIEEEARRLDKQKKLPNVPKALGGTTFTDLLDSQAISVEIDSKYPQALGINLIFSHIKMFGNFEWDILTNPFEDCPFFTSDFPVAVEKTDDPRVLNRIAPLSPDLAIRIRPDFRVDFEDVDFSFKRFRSNTKALTRKEVAVINRLIVRCAEDLVFYRDDFKWIKKFVKKNSRFRIEPRTASIRTDLGTYLLSTQEVTEDRYESNPPPKGKNEWWV